MITKNNLTQLVYFSRSTLQGDETSIGAQVRDLVKACQKKNEFSVITSFLVCDRDYFCQVLEGDRTAVYGVFQRINDDQRHRNVLIVSWREVAKREFVSSLGFAVHAKENDLHFGKYDCPAILEGGTPKTGQLVSMCLALQASMLARNGIHHMLA